jgi:hypothetical protein
MIEVGRQGDVSVGILEPGDANRETALDIMRIQGQAYIARMPHLPRAVLLDRFEANPDSKRHIHETITNLSQGEREQGWYWGVTLLGGRAVSFALYMTDRASEGQLAEVSLAELHTDPEAEGRRFASLAALAGLRRVRTRERGASDSTLVSLNVTRERPDDESEHPYRFYHAKLGFNVVDTDGEQVITPDLALPSWRMNTSLGALDAALNGRIVDEFGEFELRLPE